MKLISYLLHDILTFNQDSTKNTRRLKQSSFVDPHWQRTLPQWVFLVNIGAGRLIPVVSIGLSLSRASLWSG
jgi:hypothetical protein